MEQLGCAHLKNLDEAVNIYRILGSM